MKHLAILSAGALLTACAGLAAAQSAEGEAPRAAPPPAMPQPVTLAQRPGASGGEALFIEHCNVCHGAVGMGTGLLARAGRPEPMLEKRGNLPAQFVIVAARQGIGNMPAIPRGEVTDAEMQAIADYLAAGPHEAAR